MNNTTNRIIRTLSPIFASGLIFAIGCSSNISDRDIVEAKAPQIRSALDQSRAHPARILLLDPRSPRAFAEGHIAGAKNISLTEVKTAGPESDLAGYGWIVVCGDNPGSAPAIAMTKRLLALGYKNVSMYRGGLDDWQRKGYPVRTGQ